MNINLPLSLAVQFRNFTYKEIIVYIIAGVFLVIFAVYYNKKNKSDNIAAVKRRDTYVSRHPDLSSKYREAILQGNIIIGMDEELMVASLGHPNRTKILTADPGRSEVWIYRNGIYAHVHMGILQNWKIHRKFISFN